MASGTTAGSPTPYRASQPLPGGDFADDRWNCSTSRPTAASAPTCPPNTRKAEELKALWFAEAEKYNGLPLGDLNVFETFTRFRPTLTAGLTTFTYYPGTAPVGLGAMVELRGQSFSVLAEVAVHEGSAQGVLFKQGAGHGGHVLFVKDGRLSYVYNFMGEDEQSVTAPEPIPLGAHVFGVRYERTGTVEAVTPARDGLAVRRRHAVVATRGARPHHPATFGLSGAAVQVGATAGSRCAATTPHPSRSPGLDHQGGRRRLRHALHRPRA